jgi:hypothetical protein
LSNKVKTKAVSSLAEYFQEIEEFVVDVDTNETAVYYRGESDDFKTSALIPSIYRNGLIKNEDTIYREVSRYNNIDFSEDRTTFDKLSRMQHYSAPTRLIDLSDDPLTSLWFAKNGSVECSDACVYVLKIKKNEIKYSDSDTVTVLSNLAKIGLDNQNNTQKSKLQLANDTLDFIENIKPLSEFNKKESVKFLLHEIRNDVNHFEPIIEAKHISSILCVKPKLTNTRVKGQKGAFLLFGLNLKNVKETIPIFKIENDANDLIVDTNIFVSHPILEILKLNVKCINKNILERIGVIQPSIYPEMDKVSEYFKQKYSKK